MQKLKQPLSLNSTSRNQLPLQRGCWIQCSLANLASLAPLHTASQGTAVLTLPFKRHQCLLAEAGCLSRPPSCLLAVAVSQSRLPICLLKGLVCLSRLPSCFLLRALQLMKPQATIHKKFWLAFNLCRGCCCHSRCRSCCSGCSNLVHRLRWASQCKYLTVPPEIVLLSLLLLLLLLSISSG